MEQIRELLNGPREQFFLRNTRDNSGVIRISKFRIESRWTLRSVVWPALGGRNFLHIPIGATQKGWLSILKIIEGFLNNFEADRRQQDQYQKLEKPPKISYADMVKRNIKTEVPNALPKWNNDLHKSPVLSQEKQSTSKY